MWVKYEVVKSSTIIVRFFSSLTSEYYSVKFHSGAEGCLYKPRINVVLKAVLSGWLSTI